MGRRQSIDRNKVLDAAEQVVSRDGVASLTIDAVAKASGISKGGVQYCFGTKDEMIDAMIDRWEVEFDDQLAAAAETDKSPSGRLRAYIEATRDCNDTSADRAAVMMAAMVQSKARLEKTRAWYAERLAEMEILTQEGRRRRLAFLATEGVFLLHSFGFMPMDEDMWKEIFSDILKEIPQ